MTSATIRPRTSDDNRRPHVLVVSDDTGLTGFLNDGLVIAGCWVSVIASGIQVLEVFRLRTFELVLVDAALGGLGADELVRRLRLIDDATDRPRTDVPIMLIAETAREIEAAGIDPTSVSDVVLAPIEIDELALRIFAVVREWRALHPDRPWSDEANFAPPPAP